MLGTILYSKAAKERKAPLFTAVSAVTKLPPPAFSAQFLEPRIRVYRDYRDRLYPGMQPIDYLGFVYAK